ncbi:MAG TPA: lysoplasmalogenase [Acidimicrobiales bacterium]|nr:lysoplasmalogenase [Acidimicrobiales bacterium]
MSRPSSALYVALASVDATLAATGRRRMRRFTKPILMPALMVGRDRSTQRALAFSGAGDVALLGSSDVAFKVGLGSFLVGHLAWVVALRQRSTGTLKKRPLLALPYVAAWVGLNAFLWPRTGRDRVPVVLYSATLLATALAALDTGDRAATAGGALFLVSDSLLALERFADVHLPLHEGLVMATYTSAQALLAQG